MARQIEWQPRGVLHAREVDGSCRVWRFAPRDELADTLEHLWAVEWDLRGRDPLTSETLPHPSVHVVVEEGASGVHGVTTERFSRTLRGSGRVLGLKFHPGCFRAFGRHPVAELTDRRLDLREGLDDGEELERTVLGCPADMHAAAERAEAFLVERLREPDPEAQLARRVVRRILEDQDLVRVQDVAHAMSIGPRTLQRLFREYVGVGPKWVLQRYRLHEAVARLEAGATVDLAALAQELGFFDQAHFTRQFKALVGRTPSSYAAASKGL